MDDLISRQAIMKEFANFVRESNNSDFARTPTWNDAVLLVESMPSAQPELIKFHIDHALTEEEIKNLKQKIADSPTVLMPSAQRWIPVSERLPEEDGRYLTTNGQGWYEVASYAHRYSDIDAMYELPQDGGGWYIYDSEWGYCVYSSVVAWMPIEPWKGEKDE